MCKTSDMAVILLKAHETSKGRDESANTSFVMLCAKPLGVHVSKAQGILRTVIFMPYFDSDWTLLAISSRQ